MKAKQMTLGGLVIAAALVVFLANADVGSSRTILADWWPAAIIIAGLYMWWSNARNYLWSLITILIGVALLLSTLDVYDINVGSLILPIILLGIGINIITLAISDKRQPRKNDDDIAAFLGGSSSKNTSDNYQGGSVTAFMGGVELDLSKAKISKNATIRVTIIMGGLELRVPDNVALINRTSAFLAGTEDKTSPTPSKNAPTLTIEGMLIMGGIEVKR